MAAEEIILSAGAGGLGYIAMKLFGATLTEMGEDINKYYKNNREKIFEKAAAKVKNPDDGARPNLRVTRDVIYNGAITDSEICAEYFGGILAASRSEDGKDDAAMVYVDCIKALSSRQLHLHFAIYSAVHNLLLPANGVVNPGAQEQLARRPVWFATAELITLLQMNPVVDLNVLHRQGLVGGYRLNVHTVDDKGLAFTMATPTTFGVLLYAAALNRLPEWVDFGKPNFTHTTDIPVPSLYAPSLEKLCQLCGITNPTEDNSDGQVSG